LGRTGTETVMRKYVKSALRIGCATVAVAAFAVAPSFAAEQSAASDSGRGFAGLLRMFDIFSSHHEENATPASRPVSPAPIATPDSLGTSSVKVTSSRKADGSAKISVEIPLDDPASVAKGDGAFVYLEGGSDIVDAVDLGHRIPKVAGTAAPGSAVDSLATRAPGLGGLSIASAAASSSFGSMDDGSVWSFTPRYAAVNFGISYLSDGDRAADGKGLEIGVTSSLLRSGYSNGLEGAFLSAPLLGSGRRTYNFGFNIGYSGLSLAASLQRDTANLMGVQTAYDVGLNYRRGAFSTNVQFSAATSQSGRGLLFRINPDNRIYAFEFGAAYRLRPGISLGGGLQFFNYNSVTLSPESTDEGVVFLGGNVNF
jgi:hypothetical protein